MAGARWGVLPVSKEKRAVGAQIEADFACEPGYTGYSRAKRGKKCSRDGENTELESKNRSKMSAGRARHMGHRATRPTMAATATRPASLPQDQANGPVGELGAVAGCELGAGAVLAVEAEVGIGDGGAVAVGEGDALDVFHPHVAVLEGAAVIGDSLELGASGEIELAHDTAGDAKVAKMQFQLHREVEAEAAEHGLLDFLILAGGIIQRGHAHGSVGRLPVMLLVKPVGVPVEIRRDRQTRKLHGPELYTQKGEEYFPVLSERGGVVKEIGIAVEHHVISPAECAVGVPHTGVFLLLFSTGIVFFSD